MSKLFFLTSVDIHNLLPSARTLSIRRNGVVLLTLLTAPNGFTAWQAPHEVNALMFPVGEMPQFDDDVEFQYVGHPEGGSPVTIFGKNTPQTRAEDFYDYAAEEARKHG